MSETVAIIGDVHGEASRLEQALRSAESLDRRIVLVGDYVDRGADSAVVLDALVRAKSRLGERLVLLLGNHEAAMTGYLGDGDLPKFARLGGMATIRSYVGKAAPDVHGQFAAAVPATHQQLLRSGLETFYETADVLVSHSGFDPANPFDRGIAAMSGGHPELFRWVEAGGDLPKPLVVCGHYAQRSLAPYDSHGLVCLDTGCGTLGGPLTMLLLPEHEYSSW